MNKQKNSIWIDITNSPHVNFFARLIKELMQTHRIVVTCRPLANTIELLNLYQIPYHIVGKHYGKSSTKKIIGFVARTVSLYFYLKDKQIDKSVSHSSFYSPVVSRMLGAQCIYMNDNEHAQGNRLAFLFADKIMVPEYLNISKVIKQWAKNEKIIPYPGVKEGFYLWEMIPTASISDFTRDVITKRNVFVRPEPWTAQYYKGKRNFLDALLMDLGLKYNVKLLPRGEDQKIYYKQDRFQNIHVQENSISLKKIIEDCDLFIGAGGTMTRETAVLGIPTISIYQDELLDVDRFLISKGAMMHKVLLTINDVDKFIKQRKRQIPADFLLNKGLQAYNLVKNALLA